MVGMPRAPRWTQFPLLHELPLMTSAEAARVLGPRAAEWRVATGAWRRLHPGVYLTHSGAADWNTRAVAALLAATRPSSLAREDSVARVIEPNTGVGSGVGTRSPEARGRRAHPRRADPPRRWTPDFEVPVGGWLSGDEPVVGLGGWTAAYVDGLIEIAPSTITLVVPRRRRIHTPRGCVVLRSDTMAIRSGAWPPRTTIESTLMWLFGEGPLDEGLALIGRGLQSGGTSMAALAGELARWGRHPRRAELRDLLTSDVDGAESALELRWVKDVERPHHLPPPTRQSRRVIAGVGRRYDLDYAEARLRIELDGYLFHSRGQARLDRAKSNASAVDRRAQLRYGWSEVVTDPCAIAVEVAEVARSQGCRWPVRRCRRPGCGVRTSA